MVQIVNFRICIFIYVIDKYICIYTKFLKKYFEEL